MKTRTFLTPLIVAAGLLCGLAYQGVAQAPGGGMGGMRGMLTPEQLSKMRETMRASQADFTQWNQKLAAAQKDAVTAALAKDASEAAVRAKIEAVAKIQAEIALLRFKGVKEIGSTITDEQKTQMESAPGMAYNMLFGSLGSMGAGRGGQGGPGGPGGPARPGGQGGGPRNP